MLDSGQLSFLASPAPKRSVARQATLRGDSGVPLSKLRRLGLEYIVLEVILNRGKHSECVLTSSFGIVVELKLIGWGPCRCPRSGQSNLSRLSGMSLSSMGPHASFLSYPHYQTCYKALDQAGW